MNSIAGHLKKMHVTSENPVKYTLNLGDQEINMNALLGKKISMRYTGSIQCVQCARKTNKSFQQGYCFPCYRRLMECGLCAIHPEKCKYYEGKCDPDDWAHANCGQQHYIYIANSSGLKVGITRTSQIPTRWIDQGATQGLIMFKVQNRYLSGVVEVALKKYITDKTNWRAMLKGDNHPQDLFQARDKLLEDAKDDLQTLSEQFQSEVVSISDSKITSITYPVVQYPEKITTFNLDKTPEVEGVLQGIKGQYLILDTGVINIRKFGGYSIAFHDYSQ